MRDFDRVKDGKGGSNLKPVIIFVLICLIIIGAVAYIIINLTSQYNFLNEQYAKVQKKVMKIGSDISSENLFKREDKKQSDDTINNKKLSVNSTDTAEKDTELTENGFDIKEIPAREEIIVSREIPTEQPVIDVQSAKEYYLLQLMEGKNINEVNAVADFYNKYFNNVHIKPVDEKNSFIVQCCTTNDLNGIKRNKIEIKRRFNINPKVIKVKEWLYKENNKNNDGGKLNYVIQLSSNMTDKEAKDIMNFYKKYYLDTYIITDERDNNRWYRVRCCFSSTIDESKRKLSEIMNRFNISPVIISTTYEEFKEVKPEYKYVLELNRKKSLKDAKEIVEFYSNYLKDAYISKDRDDNNEPIFTIKCCVSSTEKEAEDMRNNLKDRFNILSKVIKIDLKKEERVEYKKLVGNLNDLPNVEETKGKKSVVRYVLQLASNKNEKETMDMAKFYKKYLEDVSVVSQRSDNDNIWYKIRCCSTESLEEANKKMIELKEQFNIEPIIVKTTE